MAIFGAGGFIGAATAAALERAGHAVTRITSREANLADAVAVCALDIPAGAYWLLAAARSPDYAGEIHDTNVAIAQAAMALAAKAKPAGIVLLSSIDVYGRANLTLPLHEGSPRNPQSPYAESKCVTEDILSEGCRALAVPLLTLRLPGVYGPGDTHRGPVRSFVEAALCGDTLHVHGDGAQVRDLLYVEDVARIMCAWMAAPVTALSNAATGRAISLNAMIATISETLGKNPEVAYHDAPQYDLTFRAPRLAALLPELVLTPMEVGIGETCRRMGARFEGEMPHAR